MNLKLEFQVLNSLWNWQLSELCYKKAKIFSLWSTCVWIGTGSTNHHLNSENCVVEFLYLVIINASITFIVMYFLHAPFYSILEEWINYVRHLQSRAKVTDAFQPRLWEAVETIRGDIEFTISCNSPETTSLNDGVTRSVNPAGFFSEQDKWLRQRILYGLLLPVTFNLAPVGCSRLPGAVSHEDTQRSSRWWQDCWVGRVFWWWSSDFWGNPDTFYKVADSWRLWQLHRCFKDSGLYPLPLGCFLQSCLETIYLE